MTPPHLPPLPRRVVRFEKSAPPLRTITRITRWIAGAVLMPPALVLAAVRGTPGLGFRLRTIGLGMRAILRGHVRTGGILALNPMDSFRYFEIDYALRATCELTARRYLDVSSPRLVPLVLTDRGRVQRADILNPIDDDLRATQRLAKALGVAGKCRFRTDVIEDVDDPDGTYDLITSISVIEHIPDDRQAIAAIWRLLRPGGTFVVTVPCAPTAIEEYTNLDEYNLFGREADGLTYWQRYYDEAVLRDRFWSILGMPTDMRIFGEIEPGSYDRNVQSKRTDPRYPFWWEPAMVGKYYRHYGSIAELPGMGVVAMTFRKEDSKSA